MNIFERIIEEHETQRDLMEQITKTSGDTAERRNLFNTFVEEFTSHAAAEEHAFYAPMLEVTATTDQSRHSVAEHHEAMKLIEELQNTEMSSPQWLVTFNKLAEENEHHMKEEEEDVFSSVRQAISSDDIDAMLATFEERKKEELNRSDAPA